MAYATIVVHVGVDTHSDDRIHLAIGLSKRFSATLIGACARGFRPIYTQGTVIATQPTDRQFEDLESTLARLNKRFHQIEGQRSSEWRSAIEPPSEFLAHEARAADILVLSRDRAPGDFYDSLDPAGLILTAGRPVLLVPPGVRSLEIRRVVIAWKDTREARRAIQDALPLLHEAETVIVLSISEGGEDNGTQVNDVIRYLQRHRIKATPRAVIRDKESAAEELIQFAKAENSDLIVAGAYGHSRLGEWIFGGVTRSLLKNSPACCLFSH